MSENTITCAVIPAAGLATRFLPASKVVPKELLPIGDKPIIHWIVDEAVQSGVTEVIVVISRGKELIRDYFQPSADLAAALGRRAKAERMGELESLLSSVDFRFVYQKRPKGLGDAVLAARQAVGERRFFVLLGDAPIRSETAVGRQMKEMSNAYDGASVIGVRRVARERVSSYGIVAGEPVSERVLRLSGIVEKPAIEAAPTTIAVSGRYILTPAIFDHLAAMEVSVTGEFEVTDAIDALLRREPVYSYEYEGVRYDIGNPDGYFEALSAYRTP